MVPQRERRAVVGVCGMHARVYVQGCEKIPVQIRLCATLRRKATRALSSNEPYSPGLGAGSVPRIKIILSGLRKGNTARETVKT